MGLRELCTHDGPAVTVPCRPSLPTPWAHTPAQASSALASPSEVAPELASLLHFASIGGSNLIVLPPRKDIFHGSPLLSQKVRAPGFGAEKVHDLAPSPLLEQVLAFSPSPHGFRASLLPQVPRLILTVSLNALASSHSPPRQFSESSRPKQMLPLLWILPEPSGVGPGATPLILTPLCLH